MNILLRQLKILLTIFLIISFFSIILSKDATPSSPFAYKVKRLEEKVKLYTTKNPSNNLNYQKILLENRLSDLKSIVSNREHSYILTSSLRYSTTAGQITEFIIKNDMKNEIPEILDLFKNHQDTIQILIQNYPKDLDMEWKFLQDDFNYLNIYSQMLSQKL